MDQYPPALVIASQEDVYKNNNVLYRLVKPLPDGSGVQSNDRLVNVVPFRRIYLFEIKAEIDEFRQQILRRPLVLQPILHFGRGCGQAFGTCYTDELWLVMVNQTHPKVLSRLQMGLDYAQTSIERGQAVTVKFKFGKLIERVYRQHLNQKELGEARNSLETFLTSFRYSEWEHGDLIIRHRGRAGKLGDQSKSQLPPLHKTFDFEDIGMHEMIWNQLRGQTFSRPHLAPLTEDEIVDVLPTWTINGLSPLECIGDSIPEHNYSYAQANRLYESFRKKKRRGHTEPHARSEISSESQPGATAMDLSPHSNISPEDVTFEHDFIQPGEKGRHVSRTRQIYQETNNPHDDYSNVPGHYYDSRNRTHISDERTSHHSTHASSHPFPSNVTDSHSVSPLDRQGRIHVDVHSKSSSAAPLEDPALHSSRQPHPRSQPILHLDPSQLHNHMYSAPLKKQDSDRSSRSTNADSGYSAEGDYLRSRGSSYDCSDEDYSSKYKNQNTGYESRAFTIQEGSHEGLDNPGFQYEHHDLNHHDVDFALEKHKEIIAKSLHDNKHAPMSGDSDHRIQEFSSQGTRPHNATYSKEHVRVAPPRKKRLETLENSNQIAESFI